jgi:hypothetical protein
MRSSPIPMASGNTGSSLVLGSTAGQGLNGMAANGDGFGEGLASFMELSFAG